MSTFDQPPAPPSAPDSDGTTAGRRGLRPLWVVAITIAALFVGCVGGAGISGSDDSVATTGDDGRVEELESELESVSAERDEARADLEEAQASAESAAADASDEGVVEELESEVTRLEGEVADLQGESTSQAETIAEMAAAAEAAEAEQLGLAPEDMETARGVYASLFDEQRLVLADALEQDVLEIDTIDQFSFDPAADAVTVSSSTSYGSSEFAVDGAWSIYRILANMYAEDSEYAPTMNVTVTGTRDGPVAFSCPGEFQAECG